MARHAGGACVLALAVGLLSGCGHVVRGISATHSVQPSLSPHGTLRAGRTGATLTIELAVADIPRRAKLLALGLKLPDGSAAEVHSIAVLPGSSDDLGAAPRVAFDLSGRGSLAGDCTRPELCLQVAYVLPAASASADGCVFSLALGEPDIEAGHRLAIAAAVARRDGSPLLIDYGRDRPGDADGALPPVPTTDVATATFRLREMPDGPVGPSGVAVRPSAVASPGALGDPIALNH